MKILRPASESEMVGEFLAGELTSARWGDRLARLIDSGNLTRCLITDPDYSDDSQNRARAGLLGELRGYGRGLNVFADYTGPMDWHLVEFNEVDIAQMRFIDYSYWNELTNGSRNPIDAALAIQNGKEPFGVSNAPFLEGLRQYREGAAFPSIVLVADSLEPPWTILEGHSRATIYALASGSGGLTFTGLLGIGRPA